MENESVAEIKMARRLLLWWCFRAREFSRKDHQKLPRDAPDGEMLEEDELKEAIANAYESERDDDDDDCEGEE